VRVRFLAKVSVVIDISSVLYPLITDFGLTNKDTIIEDHKWQNCKEELVRGRRLGYG
jgi:ATP-dependent Lon protease